jgi:hypothetical protein
MLCFNDINCESLIIKAILKHPYGSFSAEVVKNARQRLKYLKSQSGTEIMLELKI